MLHAHGAIWKKGDCYQAINPQSNMGLSFKTLLIAILRMAYTKDGIWDTYLWLTPTIGQLSQKAVLCWEQRNHMSGTWANNTRCLGWLTRNVFPSNSTPGYWLVCYWLGKATWHQMASSKRNPLDMWSQPVALASSRVDKSLYFRICLDSWAHY